MKLLIFNEDWADEHNVTALEIITGEELKQAQHFIKRKRKKLNQVFKCNERA